ncbi:MAG: hypothetical protein ACRCZZ_07370 [Phocaeicola sp.]
MSLEFPYKISVPLGSIIRTTWVSRVTHLGGTLDLLGWNTKSSRRLGKLLLQTRYRISWLVGLTYQPTFLHSLVE